MNDKLKNVELKEKSKFARKIIMEISGLLGIKLKMNKKGIK